MKGNKSKYGVCLNGKVIYAEQGNKVIIHSHLSSKSEGDGLLSSRVIKEMN
jgi:hypothetical protein